MPISSIDDVPDSQIFNVVFDFVKQNPSMALMYLFYCASVVLSDVAVPHYSGVVVNAIQKKLPLLKPFVSIVALVIVINLLITVTDWYDMQLVPSMHSFVRNRLINNTFDLYRTNFAEVQVSTLVSKMTKLPYALFGLIDQYRYTIIPQLIVFVITIGYFLRYDLLIGFSMLLVVVVIFCILIFAPKICEKSSRAMEGATNKLADELDDVFNNLMTVYAHDKEEYEKQRFEDVQLDYVRESKKMIQCAFSLKTLMFPVIAIFISFFMYRCYRLVRQKRIDTGVFVALFLMAFYSTNTMWYLIEKVRDVVPRWGRIKENVSVIDSSSNNLEAPLISLPSHVNLPTTGIYIHDVWYKYNPDYDWTIKHLTLYIPENQKVAFVGKIGSGKSTLLKLIMGYSIPQKGAIYINGRQTSTVPIVELRSMIGYVHQYPILFNRSIYDNITYGINNVSKNDVYSLMVKYKIDAIFSKQPNGLDTNVGRKGYKLSGGQRQMVWLLRIILLDPPILILDEPTASVDDATKHLITNMLETAMIGKTTIIVTHDDKLMAKANRIINLHDVM